MNVLDTNVLLYVHDPRDPQKQAKASSLMRSQTEAALPWQVICEYLAASRKLEPFGYSMSDAFRDLRDLRSIWPTIDFSRPPQGSFPPTRTEARVMGWSAAIE